MSGRIFTNTWMVAVLPLVFCANGGNDPAPLQASFIDPAYAMIEKAERLLREGDLVLRLNHDPASQFIKHFNRQDKSYSHAGIVLFQNGYPYVFHLVNGSDNPGEQIRTDSLSRFCNPKKNFAYGIYRYQLTAQEVSKLKAMILGWQKSNVRFDYSFNPQTGNRMYCSEMIAKALASATAKRISIATTQPTPVEAAALSAHIRVPLPVAKKLQLIAIDNLYMNGHCAPVFRHRF